MDTFIKQSFVVEIVLIAVVLSLLYLAVYLNRRLPKPPKPFPSQQPEVLSNLGDEIISKLDRILSSIPVEYDSTLHSSDKDLVHDKKIQREIIESDEAISSTLPNRKFDTNHLFE